MYFTTTSEPQTPQRMVENVGPGLEPSRMAGAASRHNQRAVAEAGTTGDELDAIGSSS